MLAASKGVQKLLLRGGGGDGVEGPLLDEQEVEDAAARATTANKIAADQTKVIICRNLRSIAFFFVQASQAASEEEGDEEASVFEAGEEDIEDETEAVMKEEEEEDEEDKEEDLEAEEKVLRVTTGF